MSTLTRITLGRLQAPASAGVAVGLIDVVLSGSTLEVEIVTNLEAVIDTGPEASVNEETLSAVITSELVADLGAALTGEVN